MSTAVRKMEVKALDGFYMHWFAESNLERALDAGYEFVRREEVQLNNTGIGTNRDLSGNTSLDTNVSIIGSLEGPSKGPERAYLMKIQEQWRRDDEEALFKKNAAIMEAIFVGEQLFGPDGGLQEVGGNQYVDKNRTQALFNRGSRKVKQTIRR